MRKNVFVLAAGIIFACQGLGLAASSVDTLIQKLEDKGILTSQEANQIKGEISSQEKNSQETTFKTLLPDWVSGLKITGDFRLRDQLQRKKTALAAGATQQSYNRARIRARINFEDQVNDKVKIVVGLATNGEKQGYGTGNARSNNITLGGNNAYEGSFNKSSIVLNKAYAVYKPIAEVTLMGGKMDNPIWEPASLLWDPDITPEGGAIQLEKRLNDYVTPFSTNTIFVLKDWKDETAGQYTSSGAGSGTGDTTPVTGYTVPRRDPYMFVTQDGIKGNLTEKVYYKAAASYYNISDPNRMLLDGSFSSAGTAAPTLGGSVNGNTVSSVADWQYAYKYNIVGGSVDLGMNDPFGEMLPSPINVAQIGVMGSYFENVSAPSSTHRARSANYTGRDSWLMGAYMGNSALNGWGTWKVSSYYKVLESDSWMAIFPDDDFYSGTTNSAGWRSQLDIGLAKNVWATFSMFDTNTFKYANLPGKSVPEELYQFDINFKF